MKKVKHLPEWYKIFPVFIYARIARRRCDVVSIPPMAYYAADDDVLIAVERPGRDGFDGAISGVNQSMITRNNLRGASMF